MYFILDSIIQQSETRKGREKMEEDGLVPLHSDILGGICGKRYTEAFKILENEGVVYRDSSYSAGHYSMGACLILVSMPVQNMKIENFLMKSL